VRDRLQTETEFLYTVEDTFQFRNWVPLLGIAVVDPDRDQTATAVTAGVLTSLDDPRFLYFDGFHDLIPGPDIEFSSETRDVEIIGKISLPLSQEWNQTPQGVVVSEVSPQDAIILVETVSRDALPPERYGEIVQLLLFLDLTTVVLLEDVSIEEVGNAVVVTRNVVDTASNRVSTNAHVIGGIDQETTGIISIASFQSVWDANESAFSEIVRAAARGMAMK
jgi:hypothetical protein